MSTPSPHLKRLLERASQKALGTKWPNTIKTHFQGRRIYLVGPMASGKSRIAHALWSLMTRDERRSVEIHTGITLEHAELEFFSSEASR